MGLLLKKPRSASVACNSDSELATLDSKDYKKILEAVQKRELESRIEFFIEHLLKEVRMEMAVRVSYMFKKTKMMKGNVVFREGEKGGEVFLIKKGEVQVI